MPALTRGGPGSVRGERSGHCTLIEHFTGSARWAAVAIGGEEVADEDFAVVDFVAAYDQGIKGALAAFGSEGALEKAVRLPWGEFSGTALIWLAINDQFVHGWDLARAIGHDTDLDPGLADELLVRGQAWITTKVPSTAATTARWRL